MTTDFEKALDALVLVAHDTVARARAECVRLRDEAVAKEREACSAIADDHECGGDCDITCLCNLTIAAAIRARTR